MLIHNDTFIPYEFAKPRDALSHIIQRAHHIHRSVRFVEITNEHLYIRCPIVGDYLEVVGDPDDIMWLHDMLIQGDWYRPFT